MSPSRQAVPVHDAASTRASAYSFGESATLTSEKAALYQEAAHQIANDLSARLADWMLGYTIEAAPLIEADAGNELVDPIDTFDVASITTANQVGGSVLTDHGLALTLVAGLLGGNTMAAGDGRPLTSIERRVLDLVSDNFVEAAASILLVENEMVVDRARSGAFAASDDDAPEPRIGFAFDVTGPWGGGRLILGFELWAIQRFSDVIDARLSGRRASQAAPGGPKAIGALHPVPMPFSVGLGRVALAARDVVGLAPGDVIRTGTSVSDDVVASVGSVDLFRVRLGQRGSHLTAEIITPLPGAETLEHRLARTVNP